MKPTDPRPAGGIFAVASALVDEANLAVRRAADFFWRRDGTGRIPLVMQLEAGDCGQACLAMALSALGERVDYRELRRTIDGGREGISAADIVSGARRYGAVAELRLVTPERVSQLPRGAILHWRSNHFVVLDRVTSQAVTLLDPARGVVRLPIERLAEPLAGPAVILSRLAAPDRKAERKRPPSLLRSFLPELAKDRHLWRTVLALSAVLQLLALCVPISMRWLVDRIVEGRPLDDLSIFGLGAAALVAAVCFFGAVRSGVLTMLRHRLDVALTSEAVAGMLQQPYAFFQRRSGGDLLFRVRSVSAVREIMTATVMSGAVDGTTAILSLGALLFLAPQLLALCLVLMSLQLGLAAAIWRYSVTLATEGVDAHGQAQGHLSQILEGIESVKACGGEAAAFETWRESYTLEAGTAARQGYFSSLTEAVGTGLRLGGPVVVLLIGAHEVSAGRLSLGSLLAANSLMASATVPIAGLVAALSKIPTVRVHLTRLQDLKPAAKPAAPPVGSAAAAWAEETARRLVVRRLTVFHGPRLPPAVADVSFDVAVGSFVAVVGATGAGKSSLVAALARLHGPTRGSVFFDGVDLVSEDVEVVRSLVGIVPQSPFLFSRSIHDNIAIGRDGAEPADVAEAARLACVHDEIVRLPMGYETIVSDGGSSLSGGQRQRIALARMIARNPPLMILDEPTSSIDAATEARIHENLRSLHSTKIVVAHRLHVLQNADLILVLERGHLIETGTHESLLEAGGAYAEFVAAQSGEPSTAHRLEHEHRTVPAHGPGRPA